MIRIVNSKITPALTNVKTNTKFNKNGEPYAVHQIFPLDENRSVDYARTPKKMYPICSVYTDENTAFEDIGDVAATTIETVYPNQNSSIFCKINTVSESEDAPVAPILIIPIPYRGSLSEVTFGDKSFSDNARVSVKKALIVSTTPFKYMMQKCEFNKILYLVVSAIDEQLEINFETTAIHRDEKNEMADLYIRSHKAVIRKDEDGEYVISSLDIVGQTCEKVVLADITDANKKAITDIVDIAIDDIQKAESKPTYKKKPGGNDGNQKKKFDGDKKPHDNSSSDDYHKNYNIPKDAKFTLDVASREDRNRKTARRRNKAKSKSRYDY